MGRPFHPASCHCLSYFCTLGQNVQFSHRIHFWLDTFLVVCERCIHTYRIFAFRCLWFPRPFEPFLHARLSNCTLWSSPDITCIPSLVASNIRQMSIAVSRARFLLFSKQRCRTRSSSDLHTIALRINFSVSVISTPRASGLKSVTIKSNVALSSIKFDRRRHHAGSSWRRGVL